MSAEAPEGWPIKLCQDWASTKKKVAEMAVLTENSGFLHDIHEVVCYVDDKKCHQQREPLPLIQNIQHLSERYHLPGCCGLWTVAKSSQLIDMDSESLGETFEKLPRRLETNKYGGHREGHFSDVQNSLTFSPFVAIHVLYSSHLKE